MTHRTIFDRQLTELHQETCGLLRQIESGLLAALAALGRGEDVDLDALIEGDQQINEQAQRLRATALRLIATQQPLACDLRALSVILRLLPDVERMGDHVASLAKIQRRLNRCADCLPLDELPGDAAATIGLMGHTVAAMLNGGISAFAARDAEMARRVAAMDYEADELYGQFFQDSLTVIRAMPVATNQAVHLLRLVHHLERIGDLITNVAEQVVFLTSGMAINLNPKQAFGIEVGADSARWHG
ncbi:MAG TPA: phosphate signaling complex protein PhoU [Herpetosiphonaceae bacterium]|nr:phosphate signaling complex protein PhoU [Herpetosiphonaceae bacterium]